MTKIEQMRSLYDNYKEKFKDKEVVVGDGHLECELLLIGEAPGKDEVKLSKPFVGAAGKNLNEFLTVLGIGRETIYITNAIKYRLSSLNQITGRLINRPATREEIENSREYLLNEIDIIKPHYIVTLGNVPLKSLMGLRNISIGTVHGVLKEINICEQEYKLFPLYHPASIIYNKKLKDIYMKDIQNLKDIITYS